MYLRHVLALFHPLVVIDKHNWIIGCCPSLGDLDGKDITKKRLAFVCQYFRSLFYDKKTATGKQRKFCKYTGLQRVVGGWNDGQNDDWLALSLSVSPSLIHNSLLSSFSVKQTFCRSAS